MAARTVSVQITGTSAQLQKALRDAGLVADEESTKIGDKFDSMSTRTGGIFQKLGNSLSNWGLPFGESVSKIGDKFDEAHSKGQGFGQAMSTLGGATLLGVGAGMVAIGTEAVEMADKFEPAHASLQAAVKATGSSYDQWGSKIDTTDQKMATLGFGMTDTETALAHSVVSTQNVGTSLQTMGLAADLARMKHIDLTTATDALDKALTGNMRPLKQLGIDLPITAANAQKLKTAQDTLTLSQAALTAMQNAGMGSTTAGAKAHAAYEAQVNKVFAAEGKLKDLQSAHTQILDALSSRLGGQASAYANTFTGRMAAMRAETGNLGIKLGDFLIPKITALMGAISSVIGWFEKHKAAAEALAGVITAVLGAAVAMFVVDKVTKFASGIKDMVKGLGSLAESMATTVTGWVTGTEEMTVASEEGAVATDAAIGSTGIGAILIGLGIAIMLLATHWKQVWGDIKNWFDDAVRFLRSGFGEIILMIMGPVGWIILLATHWKEAWADIKKVFSDVKDFLHSGFGEILELIMGPIGWIILLATHWKQAWGDIKAAVTDAWNFLSSAFNTIKNAIKTYIGDQITAIQIIWDTAWGAISSTVSTVWGTISSIFSTISSVINSSIGGAISAVKAVWDTVWNGIQSTVQTVWGILKPIFDTIKSAISGITSGISAVSHAAGAVGGAIGSVGSFLGFSEGGLVPGTPGQAVPAVVHGGEYVLPQAIVSAIVSGTPPPAGAMQTSSSSAGSTSSAQVIINGYNLSDPQQTASEIAWAMKTAPV